MEKKTKQVPTKAEMETILSMRRAGSTYSQIDAEFRKRGRKGMNSWRLLREGLVEAALKSVIVPPTPAPSPSPPAEPEKHARTIGRRRGDRVAQGIADLVTTIVETTLANGKAGAARVAHPPPHGS